jgi:DNA primase
VPSDAKERIRERLDIAEVVGEVVALKSAGKGRLKGLCPFHGEKTPSFHVMQDRGFFYCFGCQAKGDVFDFVMRTQGVEFGEALQVLGQQAGIEVTPSTPRDLHKRDLFEVNKLALEFFKSHLPGVAETYLLDRKLTRESIEAFDLGFAPESWDALLKYALNKGIKDTELLRAGLLAESESGRRYDRFRNRVMFPIKDFLGRVVGFSGRVLDDSLPKYVNTPETDVFRKGELLYGLDTAKHTIRATGECLVVEGYMDVIALHQTGFATAVAALGATLTAEQAGQLSRLEVQKLYLAFDADEAGQRAVLSGLEQSVGRQFLVKAVRVPHGKDPADAVLGGYVEAFRESLTEGFSANLFKFESAAKKYSASSHNYKESIFNDLLPSMVPHHLGGEVEERVAVDMRLLVASRLRLDEAKIDYLINAFAKRKLRKIDGTHLEGVKRSSDAKVGTRTAVIELELIALLLLEPNRLEERLLNVVAALPSEGSESLLREFTDICHACAFDDRAILHRYRERDEGRVLFERLLTQQQTEEHHIDIDAHLHKSLSRLRELYLSGEKETQRKLLLERMQEVSSYLTNANLPTDKLQHYYAELKEINAMLAARDAERRTRVPTGYANRKRR